MTVPYRHASKAERTNRTAVESSRASLLQASFPDTWWAVCMIYFVAMWNGHMRGRDGFTPYQRRHGEDAPYQMYPGSLVFADLHKPVVEDEEESDRWRSKLTPCTLVEVTMGPAGVWERCYGVVPLFRFTSSNRPSAPPSASERASGRRCDIGSLARSLACPRPPLPSEFVQGRLPHALARLPFPASERATDVALIFHLRTENIQLSQS